MELVCYIFFKELLLYLLLLIVFFNKDSIMRDDLFFNMELLFKYW